MTYGTDPEMLHGASSSDTSIEAAHAVDTTKLERMVHEAIKRAGPDGCIADELLAQFRRFPYSSITARFAALERKSHIFRSGEKRKGRSGRSQQVMRDIQFGEQK